MSFRSIVPILIVLTFSRCQDHSYVTAQVQKNNSETVSIQEKLILEIERKLAEYGIEDRSILKKRDDLIEISKSTIADLQVTSNSAQAQAILDNWSFELVGVYESTEKVTITHDLPFELLKEFGVLEVNRSTNRVLSQMSKDVEPDEASFEALRLFFEPTNTKLTLGQTFKGKVYFGATSKFTPQLIDLTVNGDTVEFDEEGVGLINFRPSSRGSHTLKFLATGKSGSSLKLTFQVEKELKVQVE